MFYSSRMNLRSVANTLLQSESFSTTLFPFILPHPTPKFLSFQRSFLDFSVGDMIAVIGLFTTLSSYFRWSCTGSLNLHEQGRQFRYRILLIELWSQMGQNLERLMQNYKLIKIFQNIQKMSTIHQLLVECEGRDTIKVLVTEKDGQRKKRKVKTWSTQQDQLLARLYEKFPKKWNTISGLMDNRNENQCLHRFRRLSQMGNHQKIWLEEEDEMVKKLVKKFGKNWKVLSEIIGTKTGKQIRERYINKLDPRIKKEDWSEEEDLHLISLYTSLGSHWSQIAKKLPGRPQNKIKNRFYSYIKRTYNIRQVPMNAHPHDLPVPKPLKQPQIIFKPHDKENQIALCEIMMRKENHLTPQQSKLFIQSSSFFLHDATNKICGKPQNSSITSFSYFPEEDCLLYLDFDRGF